MPGKVNGTRWIQHKSRTCTVFMHNCAIIVAYQEAQTADESSVPPDEGSSQRNQMPEICIPSVHEYTTCTTGNNLH